MKEKILENLRLTMDNFNCMDKKVVSDTVDDYLERVEFHDDYIYLDDYKVKDFGMLVAHIKRELLTK